MFKNEYQGGAVVEVFSAQGKDPVAKWKLSGQPSIIKMFDKELKGFVYSLEGSSPTHRMQLPKDGKMPLALIQKFLVLQVTIPPGKDFSTELVVTDQQHLKRRLYLSTVHKEISATPLHARIPLTCLKRNTWCNLCIDLSSFTAKLFRGAVFLSVDGIIISACCKVRRIFTMKNEPADHEERDPYDLGSFPKDEIPKSCQFPPEVQHITQLINMEILRQADLRGAIISSDSEQSSTGKPQDCSHIAFGSKVTRYPPLAAKKSSSVANMTDHKAKSGKNGRRKTQLSADQAPSSESTRSGSPKQIHKTEKETRDTYQTCRSHSQAPNLKPSECQSSSESLPDLHLLKNVINDAIKTTTSLSLDEDNEEHREEVFTFPSCSHSAKRGQPFSEPFVGLSSDLKSGNLDCEGGRKEAPLEDDFVGSDNEEDQYCLGFLSQSFAAPTRPIPSTSASVNIPRLSSTPNLCTLPAQASSVTYSFASSSSEGSRRTKVVCMAPTRCLSPCTTKLKSRQGHSEPERSRPNEDIRVAINISSLQEIPFEDATLHKVRESMRRMPVGSSTSHLSKRAVQEQDEEELRMSASLKRQNEEERVGTCDTVLNDSQQCNVSLSMSSDDTSTWTQCIPLASEQDQWYHKDRNPLLGSSNPREWMDVLSPPIIHPRHQQTKSKENDKNMPTKGSVAEENYSKNEFLSLLYDSCLNCYFDPQTGKYYELI